MNTTKENKALEEFPEYNEHKPETWVGSKQYYEAIFESETNRDPKLHDAFSKLHENIVNMVIQFCEKHGLKNVDAFYVGADGLTGSFGFHEWCPYTDSSMTMHALKNDKVLGKIIDKEPFLHEI